ncbi:zinc-binding dehydrogenase [Nocardioides nitrophenolicus]|uniref:zinc-binding dehydrogenase n=1 Tax=Nocardioides nitrophenolicus TaxID=60489 RepID=UPI00195ABFF5|nr:zinc-binding dehydrogenase [Nocardioides nitrophenolicus]MBM7517064.1 NADPH:quinone reductase-like Zn-dependent oxidoreductase [Nocardioides nitrophenolicus]
MTTMRAVRVHGWGAPPTVDLVPRPRRAEGESLVRVEAAAVSHLDLTVAGGRFDLRPALPYVGGTGGCGVVVESDTVPVGERVLLRGGGLGLKRDGTWAEYVAVPDRNLSGLPHGLAPEVAATFFTPLTTAAAALRHVARLGEWGDVESAADELVVVGGAAGGVGSMVVQLALREGAEVIGVVADEEQAASLPADVEPVVSTDAARAAELARDRPASLLVDTLGGPGLGARCGWVRPGGRAVSIGYVAGTELSLDLPNWLLQDVALLPVNMIRRDREARELAAELAPLLAAGQLAVDVEPFGFEDSGRALELLGSGKLRGRAVLVPRER